MFTLFYALIFTAPFLFELLDTLKGGYITSEDLVQLIEDLYGAEMWKSIPEARLIMRDVPNANLLPTDFYQYIRNHQRLLSAFYELRSLMRKSMGGEHYWDQMQYTRNKLPLEKFKNAIKFATETFAANRPFFDVEVIAHNEGNLSVSTFDFIHNLFIH